MSNTAHLTHINPGSVPLVGSWFVKIIVPILFGSKDFVSDHAKAAFIAEKFTLCARHLCRQLDWLWVYYVGLEWEWTKSQSSSQLLICIPLIASAEFWFYAAAARSNSKYPLCGMKIWQL